MSVRHRPSLFDIASEEMRRYIKVRGRKTRKRKKNKGKIRKIGKAIETGLDLALAPFLARCGGITKSIKSNKFNQSNPSVPDADNIWLGKKRGETKNARLIAGSTRREDARRENRTETETTHRNQYNPSPMHDPG